MHLKSLRETEVYRLDRLSIYTLESVAGHALGVLVEVTGACVDLQFSTAEEA